MKFVVLMCGALLLGHSATMAMDDGPDRRSPASSCDSVCELRAQDGAFSLLIEAYRQYRTHQIQADYEGRLHGAESLGKADTSLVVYAPLRSVAAMQTWIKALAWEERDLRLAQLDVQVVSCLHAYQHLRHQDEVEAGVTVASAIDTRAAAAVLKGFLVVSPGSFSTLRGHPRPSDPGLTVLLDDPPAVDQPGPVEVSAPRDNTPPPAGQKLRVDLSAIYQSAILP